VLTLGGIADANFEEVHPGKVRFGGTPKPARETRALPGSLRSPELRVKLDNE